MALPVRSFVLQTCEGNGPSGSIAETDRDGTDTEVCRVHVFLDDEEAVAHQRFYGKPSRETDEGHETGTVCLRGPVGITASRILRPAQGSSYQETLQVRNNFCRPFFRPEIRSLHGGLHVHFYRVR